MASKKRTGGPARRLGDSQADSGEALAPQLEFLVVGVGASAGGLEAYTRLLKSLPADSGMAFVLVQHLAPAHDSALAGILARATSMKVTEVTDACGVETNHVYVIPPDRDMVLSNGTLQLSPRVGHGLQHPIDVFFRSLAREQRNRAIGVVLSGNATDGTLGLEEIKAEGGITFAQDHTAQFEGMPRSAFVSGCVDFVLPPEAIAHELARIAAHPFVQGDITAPDAGAAQGAATDAATGVAAPEPSDLAPILARLRDATGVDFDSYKPNTLVRRISRRMVLRKQDSFKAYAALLGAEPAEVEALYRDILINVTGFFRDPEMFAVLQAQVIPALLSGRSRHDPLRVWVLGCSTGEEAYSLAMALAEVMDVGNGPVPAQIFATDLNAADVELARAGVYSAQRVQGLSPERLSRFFTESKGSYRVTKPVRDMCVFARHNILSDPPFSKMDLISCRNLLIYIEPVLQQKIIPILHYALKSAGYLVLGASESVGPFRGLHPLENTKQKIFAKRSGVADPPRGVPVPRRRGGAHEAGTPDHSRFVDTGADPVRLLPAYGGSDLQREADRLMLQRFAPAGVLVDAELEILQFRGNTDPYLSPAPGKASLNVLKMAREGLLVPLQALLKEAKAQLIQVSAEGLRIRAGDAVRIVHVEVVPVRAGPGSGMAFLVMFHEPTPGLATPPRANPGARKPAPPRGRAAAREDSAETIARLEHELASLREYLQSLTEQQEAANEELQSANEEAQSANEELQSINEELETSKEEIQSTNEELTTVNDELHNRIIETGQLNSDLTNLISSIQIAIVIVGRDLRIRRYSPTAEKLLNVIPTDIGRPITDIRMNLGLPDLDPLLAEAMGTNSIREREVQDAQGHWFALRVRPYVMPDQSIDGAVLMLMDIDGLKRAEHAIAAARDYAEAIVRTVRDPLLILNADLRVRTANEAFYATFQTGRAETEGRSIFDLGNGQWQVPELRRLLEEVLAGPSFFSGFEVTQEFAFLGQRTMLVSAHALGDAGDLPPGILVGVQDITELLDFQVALTRSELRYRRLFEAAKDGVLIVDPTTRKIVDANPFMTELLGYTHQELLGKELYEIGVLSDETANREAFRELQVSAFIRYDDLPLKTRSGDAREVEMVSNLYREAEDTIIQCSIRDITARKHSERELARRVEELAAIDAAKGQFLAVLAHELRSPLNAIRGWLQILNRPGRTEDDLDRGLDVIDRNSKLQIELISDLLDAHRIGAGKTSLTLRRIDLRDALAAALETIEPAAAEKHIQLKRDIPVTPASVSADPGRLQQVLVNVLANALKFTPPGGSIHMTLRLTDSRAELTIADTGEGISAEALPHLFEPYRQAESETSRSHAGLGLGLSIARQIMQLHAGTIDAASAGKGKGAAFTISLPIRDSLDPAPVSISPSASPAPLSVELGGVLVLVVDDEPDAREPVRRVLEDAGAQVLAVASAEEALEAVRQQNPDVIISDIAMPGRDGYALIGGIRALPPGRGGRVPAIALTAYATAEDRARAMSAGFNVHLAKPIEPADLIAAVTALVRVPRKRGAKDSGG